MALLVASLVNTGTNKSEFVIAMCHILIEKGKGYKHKCVPTRAHKERDLSPAGDVGTNSSYRST